MQDLGILDDLVVVFAVAVAVVALLRRIGVPSIAGFIVAGILVGPGGLALVGDVHEVEFLAEIGVVLLLFGIGLELSLSRLQRLWYPILVGGAGQVGLTILVAWGVAYATGMGWTAAVVCGFVAAVSSTAIVLRGLAGRGELEAPHGRIVLGILIFQDLSVVPMMLVLPMLAGEAQGVGEGLLVMGRALLVLVVVVGVGRLVVPRLMHVIARTGQRDLFILSVFLVCVGTAWAVASAGMSLALGAFLAGLVVADSEYRHQAMSDLIPFREVLTSLFFVSVGMLLDLDVPTGQLLRWVGLTVVLILGKGTLVAIAVLAVRLPVRVAVIAGAALAQMGEFSFVLLSVARENALLPRPILEELYAVAILSMLVTPLLLTLGPRVAAGVTRIRVLTRLLDVRTADLVDVDRPSLSGHVVIAGYGIAGIEIGRALTDQGVNHVIVDLNADRVRRAQGRGEAVYFGDVTSPEVLEHLHLAEARGLIVVINDPEAAQRAVATARRLVPDLPIMVRARFLDDCEPLYLAGATEVVPGEVEAAAECTARIMVAAGATEEQIVRRKVEIRARWPGRPDAAAATE